MKSLEIIENNRDYNGDIVLLKSKDVETIKQYLEVLEILKEVVFERVGYYKIKGNSPKYRTIIIRDNDDRFIKIELSEDEMNKVKQWLEENKNE